MLTRILLPALGGVFALAALATTSEPAAALTQKECSAKYQAAKAANTLNGMNYAAFRKAECGTGAAPAAAAPAATPAPKTEAAKPAPTPASAPAGAAVFPTAIAPAYTSEKAGTARRHTCRDQFRANKANNANGGLKWIQKGGGYYSECNSKLKGAA